MAAPHARPRDRYRDRHADPFPRRTATPARMAPWLVELAQTLPGLAAAYGPRAALDPRTRERVSLAVTEVNGCRYCAWIHGSWQDFLGDAEAPASEAPVIAYALACAETGQPQDPAGLPLPAEALRALRATIAQIEVSNLVGNTVDGLIARLTRKRPAQPVVASQEVAAVAAALPIALPLLGTAAAMRALDRLAPPFPPISQPPAGEANLLVHLLAEAIPSYLAIAPARLVLLRLPVRIAVGLRAGRTSATVRVGRGAVELENGIARDAVVVIEGEVEPLLRVASGSLLEELARLRIRRA